MRHNVAMLRAKKAGLVLIPLLLLLPLVQACTPPGERGGAGVRNYPAVTPLPIPAIAQTSQRDGRTIVPLRIRTGRTDFGQPGGPADTLGINGTYLGPTIRLTRGEQVRAVVHNSLSEMTTLHWHGMHVPAKSDGGPHSMIDPGQTWRPEWTVRQPAATLWYHSHPHGQTAQQVYRGVAGMLILDDPGAADVGLPHEYGVDDVPLIVQDKSFTADGQLIVDPQPAQGPSTGFLGDTIVTNGKIGTYLPVTTEAVRLRLLNASNARAYAFGLDDDRTFDIVASDGGLLAAPVPAQRVQLSPGDRAEIVVRLQPGETVALTSTPPDLGTGADARYSGGTFTVTELRAAAELRPSPVLAAQLTDLPPPDPTTAETTREFRIQGRAINGRPMQMARIDLAVPVDTPEIWEVTNQDRQPHNFHVHNVQFRILSRGSAPPPPELAGYKDTMYVAPQTTARILVRFTDYTDRNWPYMFHCHLLLHEDLGVMGHRGGEAGPDRGPTTPPLGHVTSVGHDPHRGLRGRRRGGRRRRGRGGRRAWGGCQRGRARSLRAGGRRRSRRHRWAVGCGGGVRVGHVVPSGIGPQQHRQHRGLVVGLFR